MSPERNASTFALFPLGEKETREARTWVQGRLHSPDMQDSEIEKLKNSNPDLYLYLQKMGFLRGLVQFDGDSKTQRAYWNGAFYALEALNSKYDLLFKDLPIPSQDTMKTHFFNLIDVENNHGAVASFAPNIFGPDKNFTEMMDEFLVGFGNRTFDEIVKYFAINSQYRVHDIFYDNPLMEEDLTRTSLNQTHGPALGLVYGAFDVYEIFRLNEENLVWEERFAIPTR